MGDHSPGTSGLCREFKPAVHDPGPRAKRLLDSSESVWALQSAKRACLWSHHCSTPNPPEELLLCSPDPACCQGSSLFLDDTGHDDPVATSPPSKYDDVTISLDTTRSFDDSEPDDSLLELSGGEEGDSPFTYTEEEIQEILAGDCVESERYPTKSSALSQNVNGEKDKSGSAEASVIREDADTSEIAEEPQEPLSRECSLLGSERLPSFLCESTSENHQQLAQVTDVLFDLDIQELLSLSPIDGGSVDGPLEDSCLEEAESESSEAVIKDCLECDQTAGSSILTVSSEGLVPSGRQSLAVDFLAETPITSRDGSDPCGEHRAGSVSSSRLRCGQRTADENSAPGSLRCATPSSRPRNRGLSKATKSCFPEDDEGKSAEAERPSDSAKLSQTAVGQIGQAEAASGKKAAKVISVPREEDDRPKQWACISEAEPEQKKRLCPACARPFEESCSSSTR